MNIQKLRPLALWLAAPLAAGIASAAPANGIGGPVSGFVVDGRGHALRPINGIHGSATLGAPLSLPFSAGLAAVSTRMDYAILTDARGTGEPYLARGLASGTPTVNPLSGGIVASQAALADSGTAAVLYSQPDGRLQFVTGLPAQPQAGSPVDVSALSGGVAALAVDATGATALLLAGDGGIYSVAANGTGLHFIVRAAGASSASLLPNGQDALVASRSTGDVLVIRDFAGAAAVSTVAGASTGITSALAVRALNAHEAAVVDGSGRLAIVNLDTSDLSWQDLAGKADRIQALDTNLLVLNQPGAGPLLLLDTTQGRAAYFVPPDATTNFEPHKGKDIWKH